MPVTCISHDACASEIENLDVLFRTTCFAHSLVTVQCATGIDNSRDFRVSGFFAVFRTGSAFFLSFRVDHVGLYTCQQAILVDLDRFGPFQMFGVLCR